MYILPMLTHLEVVALGGRSDIFFSNILIVNRTPAPDPQNSVPVLESREGHPCLLGVRSRLRALNTSTSTAFPSVTFPFSTTTHCANQVRLSCLSSSHSRSFDTVSLPDWRPHYALEDTPFSRPQRSAEHRAFRGRGG